MFDTRSRRAMTVLLILLPLSGCFQNTCPSPESYNGSLSVRLSVAEQQNFTSKATVNDISTVSVSMSLDKADMTLKTDPVAYTGNGQEIIVEKVYPGNWRVSLNCYDAAQTIIYTGNGNVTIASGSTATAELSIHPAPGSLHVSLDPSRIPDFSSNTTGTVYVYEEAQGSALETGALTVQEGYLKGTVAIGEGTYQVKVAVPNVTKAVFLSPYYTVDVHTGINAVLNIAPDGSLIINGIIDSIPDTPTDFEAVYDKPNNKVKLQWNRVTVDDLNGYRIYRTNSDGNFIRLTDPDKDTESYTDIVTASNFHNGLIRYAISSYDRGGNESFWSAPAKVSK